MLLVFSGSFSSVQYGAAKAEGAANAQEITRDTTAPVISLRSELSKQVSTNETPDTPFEQWTKRVAKTVTVSDEHSGVDDESLKYIWSSDRSFPSDDDERWALFVNKSTLELEGESGVWHLHVRAKDNAGNEAKVTFGPYWLDNTPPTNPVITLDPEGWSSEAVSVQIEDGKDQDHLSGVAYTEYHLGDENWIPYNSSFEIKENGETIIYARTMDKAGNESQIVQAKVQIDQAEPGRPTIDRSHDDWVNHDVTITLSGGDDASSGLKHYEYRLNGGDWQTTDSTITISDEGQTRVEARSVSRVGNKSETVETMTYIERRPPTITLFGDEHIIMEKGTHFEDAGAWAEHERFGNLTSEILRKGEWDSNTPGNYELLYTVTDPAGNHGVESRIIDVIEVTSLDIGEYPARIEAGESYQINVTPLYEEDVQPSITHTARFISSDKGIATVDADGTVHFHGSGDVTITVMYGDQQATIAITVYDTILTPGIEREVEAGKSYTLDGIDVSVLMPVDLPDGTRLQVDTIGEGETDHPGLTRVGAQVHFSFSFADGAVPPAQPYLLTMGYTEGVDGEKVALYKYDERNRQWSYWGGEVDPEERKVALEVSNFSAYGVFSDTEAPELKLEVSEKSHDQVTLNVSLSDGSGIAQAELRRNGQSIQTITDETHYTDSDVEAGKMYTYSLWAVDRFGYENEVEVTVTVPTHSEKPTPPGKESPVEKPSGGKEPNGGKDEDLKDKQKEKNAEKDQEKSSQKLPNTATSQYGWMMAGITLILAAAILWMYRRKRA